MEKSGTITESSFSAARNSLIASNKASDFTGAARDSLGKPVRNTSFTEGTKGEYYDHFTEVMQTISTYENVNVSLEKRMAHLEMVLQNPKLTEEQRAILVLEVQDIELARAIISNYIDSTKAFISPI